jgi:hypothetical protein
MARPSIPEPSLVLPCILGVVASWCLYLGPIPYSSKYWQTCVGPIPTSLRALRKTDASWDPERTMLIRSWEAPVHTWPGTRVPASGQWERRGWSSWLIRFRLVVHPLQPRVVGPCSCTGVWFSSCLPLEGTDRIQVLLGRNRWPMVPGVHYHDSSSRALRWAGGRSRSLDGG